LNSAHYQINSAHSKLTLPNNKILFVLLLPCSKSSAFRFPFVVTHVQGSNPARFLFSHVQASNPARFLSPLLFSPPSPTRSLARSLVPVSFFGVFVVEEETEEERR
jgi:hypothetical protein